MFAFLFASLVLHIQRYPHNTLQAFGSYSDSQCKRSVPWRSKNYEFEHLCLYLGTPDKQYFTMVQPSALRYVHIKTLSL